MKEGVVELHGAKRGGDSVAQGADALPFNGKRTFQRQGQPAFLVLNNGRPSLGVNGDCAVAGGGKPEFFAHLTHDASDGRCFRAGQLT